MKDDILYDFSDEEQQIITEYRKIRSMIDDINNYEGASNKFIVDGLIVKISIETIPFRKSEIETRCESEKKRLNDLLKK